MFSILLFFFLALISEVIGTIGGFGSSVFFVPVAEFFYDFKTVLMLTAILHDFSNSAKLIMFRKHIDFRLLLIYGLPSTVFVIIGAYLSNYLEFRYNELILGVFLILFSVFIFVKPSFRLSTTIWSSLTGGSAAGFLAGLIGTGGALRGMSLAAFNLEKNIFIATSAAIDFFVDFSRTIIYFQNGYFQPKHYSYIPFLLVTAFVGTYLGKISLKKISQENFRRIVLTLLLLIGITMIVRVLFLQG
ncbi:MAG: sulfite exporter TauE/SafE family protein [Bacteroidia bacterium]|nr:sulfite exporter TauE/SafE family protein [Bacteroidia bacterium]